MEKLYSVDKVDFFLGGFANALIIPQLAIAEKYKVPIVVTTIGSTAEFERVIVRRYFPSPRPLGRVGEHLGAHIRRAGGRLRVDAVGGLVVLVELVHARKLQVVVPASRVGHVVAVLSQWQNGKDELIWPTDQASAPLAYPAPPWDKR
ncbi:MAG: hypothetical protein HY900_12200 [Deltaproteobacteria bacterium]|nr:hypothetical protein [Deltaproteobacteria bacterium]